MKCFIQLLLVIRHDDSLQWISSILAIATDTLPCRHSTQPIASCLAAASLIWLDPWFCTRWVSVRVMRKIRYFSIQ